MIIKMMMLNTLNQDIISTEERLVELYSHSPLDGVDFDEINELEDHVFKVQTAKRRIIRD